MTISNQKAFDSILSMAQNMLRLAAERAQSPVTPEMIEKELNKLAIMMEDDFVLVDRDALVDELIRRSSRTVGDNATLSSGEDHVAWLDAERKKGWTYWQRYSEYMQIPRLSGQAFRFEAGHHSGMKPARIPINIRPD